MLEATRMALPRSLDSSGFTLKSKTMSLTSRPMRDLELSTFCIVAHCFFSSSFCQWFSPFVLASNQASIFSSEPSRWSMSLAELVSVDVAAEHLQACLRVFLEEGCASEADEGGVGHHRVHHPVQLAALAAVAFVHENEHLAHGRAGLRLESLDEGLEVVDVLTAELVHQRAEQARLGLAELTHQIAAVACALDGFARLREDTLDLLVQLVAIRDDGDAGVGVVLQDPLGEQHHHDALAAPLRVPDDSALPVARMRLRGLDAEILVSARQLLPSAVEDHEVVHQFDQPVLAAHLQEVLVQLEAAVVALVLLPLQEVLLLRIDGAIPHPLGVVAGENELDRAEERGMEHRLLVREALANPVADR